MESVVLATPTRPCAKCPFKDGDWLRRERRQEIANDLMADGWFACHATVDYGEGEGPDADLEEWWEEPDGRITDRSKECVGSIVVSDRSGFWSQYRRIMVRVGGAPAEVDGSAIPWQSLGDWVLQGEEPGDTCSVVNEGCLAPAGYAIGGGAVEGTEFTDTYCESCGEPVCENCMDNGRCDLCIEEEEGTEG